MKTRFAIAIALLTSVLWIGSSPVSAYVRNAPLEVVTVTCSATDDTVYVVWNKDAGKPYWVNFQVTPADRLDVGGYGQRLAIPGSRGSKGNWTVSFAGVTTGDSIVGLDTSQAVTVLLYNKDLSVESTSVVDICG